MVVINNENVWAQKHSCPLCLVYVQYIKYLLSRIAAVEQHTWVQFRGNHTFKCQLWLLAEKYKRKRL